MELCVWLRGQVQQEMNDLVEASSFQAGDLPEAAQQQAGSGGGPWPLPPIHVFSGEWVGTLHWCALHVQA